MLTFVFPGQGSQSKGMGGTLFDEFPDLTQKADDILGYSIKNLCMEDPNITLSQTQYTQPALYTVNALSYLKRMKETGIKPDFVAGHSLGEYNALLAAGAFDFRTGLKLVKKRGELMGHATGGGMAAVIGLTEVEIVEVLKKHDMNTIAIANLNSPFQIVISGPKSDIDNAKQIFENTKNVKMYTLLKTSGAFHSIYMEEAKKEYELFLDGFVFSELTIPVISNAQARPYRQIDIKQNLVKQITHPVKWTESIQYLMGLGEMEFVEIGNGKILNGLIQRIKKEAEPLVITDIEKDNKIKNDTNSMITEPDSEAKTKESMLTSIGKMATGVIKSVQEKSKVVESTNQEKSKNKKQVAQRTKETSAQTIKVDRDTHDINEIKQAQRTSPEITSTSLGSAEFKKDYNLKYAYLTGGMYRGVASKEIVIKMGKAGMMGLLGTGGMDLSQIKEEILYIQKELSQGQAYGMNFLHSPDNPEIEEKTITLFLEHGIKNIEAAAFMNITPALVLFHAKGLKRDESGIVVTSHKIIAKLSRPEVAEGFLCPAPERILTKLLEEHKITPEEAELSKEIPVADDICVEADSGGHTDGGVAYTLMPAMIKLRDEMMVKYQYRKKVRIGAAGGIGTPEAAAAALILGADFIVTGSINQCTAEAGTSDAVKDLLQQMNVQDTEYAPAGDMFEMGAKVQVLKKGSFFPARANKLYELYRLHNSLDEIDPKTRTQIEEKYFKRSFAKVYEEVKTFFSTQIIEDVERNPKRKMALVFRWYFGYSTQLALNGSEEGRVDYQINTGPALGAFNQWVKGTSLENWRNRHVDEIALKLMTETANLLNQRYNSLISA